MTFGITEDDKIILERLKNNRDARQTEDTNIQEDKIEPVIVYTTALSVAEMKAKKKARSKESCDRRKAERLAAKMVNNMKPALLDIQSSPEKRSSPKAEIVVKDGEVTMIWHRKVGHDKARGAILFCLPKELHQYFSNMITITFQPITKTLVIKPVDAS